MMVDRSGLAAALLLFALSAAVIVIAGTRLARAGDVIAAHTRLGGVWFGSVFLALATSLPELATSLSAALMSLPDIAAGNLFGSSMANMLILALLTLLPSGSGLFGRVTLDQVMSASVAIVLNCMAGAFVLAQLPLSLGSIAPGSLVLLTIYLLGTRLLFRHSTLARQAAATTETVSAESAASARSAPTEPATAPAPPPERRISRTITTFVLAALVIMVVAPVFARSAERIALLTGLSQTVVGTWMVGLATSLPELVTSLAALRLGALDMAVGNLFGSNAVNMLMFVPLDIASLQAPIFASASPQHAISAFIATAMMGTSLIALIYRVRHPRAVLEPAAAAMIALYAAGMLLVGLA